MSTSPADPNSDRSPRSPLPGPPTKHQLAVMIWLAVFPTLTVLNLALGDWLGTLTPVGRTFVLATIAVPIVIYGLMPQLHRLRRLLLTRRASVGSGFAGNRFWPQLEGQAMTTVIYPDGPDGQQKAPMSRRRIATAVAILFVAQMVTAMFGTSLIQAFVDGNTDRTPMTVGVLLMMCSGLAVVGIGLLMYPILRDVHPTLAAWYPILRVAECLVSAACGVYLLAQSEVVPNHMLWVYVPTGVGGIIFTYLLFVSRLVPRPIALLGLVGYVSLALGVPLDLLGVLDMGAGAGLLLVVPGGLFELVFLPIWLIAKGFSAPSAAEELNSQVLVTSG